MRKETKIRSLTKTILWRIVATLNSFTVLCLVTDPSATNLHKAVYMNITGFIVYYLFERMCNLIKWGFEKPAELELLLEKEKI
jgi:uncharacterized membrane protein